MFDRLTNFSDTHEDLGSGVINSPTGKRKVGVVDNRQCPSQVGPSLVPVAVGKRDPGQQAIGQRQVIVIGRRRRVVAELDGPSPRLLDLADLQIIFTKAMIA